MPRTGGVYSPPAGTKGVSNTTIQSVPYNSFVDDLTADANAARPITAGGTGSTTASGARTALGLGTAATQNTGTSGANVPLLNGNNTYSGTSTFNASITIALGNLNITGPSSGIEIGRVDGVASTPVIDIHSGATATDFDSRIIGSGGTGVAGGGTLDIITATLTKSGNVIWHAGNDGTGSGLDAGLFAGQLPAYYTDIVSRLGFTPVQQGGGIGQGSNKVYLGLTAGPSLSATIDVTNLGRLWSDNLATGGPSSGWVKFPNGLILQSGTTVVTTNASADGSISFPSTFPTSCTSVVGVGGDVTVPSTDLKIGSLTTTSFNFRAPGAASQSVRVNWIAWGY